MRIIGIDLAYAKPIQIAVLSSRGRLITLSSVLPDSSFFHMAKQVQKHVLPFYPALVVMERPGIYNNRTTGLKLFSLASMIEALISDSGMPIAMIQPKLWQKELLGKVENRKIASIELADKTFKAHIGHPLNDDEADALNIASYGIRHFKSLLKKEVG